MRIHITGRQIDNFKTLITGSATAWGEWCSMQRWRQVWSRVWSRGWSWVWILLSASVERRCTCSLESPAPLLIQCGATLTRKASWRLMLTKHSLVACYRSLHLVMPRKLNTPLHLFSELGTWFHDQILRFLSWGARKPSFGHFAHDQGQGHVGLFQLYTTSLPCHRYRHVQCLQEIGCCFTHWAGTMTSTI